MPVVNCKFAKIVLATTIENASKFSDSFLQEHKVELIPLKDFSVKKLMAQSNFKNKRVVFEFGPTLGRKLILDPNDQTLETFILTIRIGDIKATQLADKLCNFKDLFVNYELKFKSETIKGQNAEWNFYVFERRKKMTLFD